MSLNYLLARILCLLALTGFGESLHAQRNPNLEERFGFREWRLGSTTLPSPSADVAGVQTEDPCFQLYRVGAEAAGSLKHIPITGIDLTYQAEALQNVAVDFAADHFTEVLAACEQVFGETEPVAYAADAPGEAMQWIGEGILLELSIVANGDKPSFARLSYEWTSPTTSYDACVESKKPKFGLDDF